MIFRGRYRYNQGAYRPFITAYVRSQSGQWVKHSFLVDSGADETFLPYRSVEILEMETARVQIRDDVGGVGGYGLPYFRFPTEIKFVSTEGMKLFGGEVNVFLDPHATDVPLLGRDVLDTFVVVFDRKKDQVLLLDDHDDYRLERR